MRVVLVGNRSLARHVLRYLLETDWNIVGAVGAGDDTARRQAGFEHFDALAESHGLPLITTDDINTETTRRELAGLDPDLCICPGWHQILGEAVLDVPERGFVGFHASCLPKGRGGAPVNWAMIEGAETICISLFRYTPGVDAGDVLRQETVSIEDRDDVGTVLDRLAVAACDALGAVRDPLHDGDVSASPQRLSEASYRPRRQPQDGIVDWSLPPRYQCDWIRAQTEPYPGAYTFYDGRRLTVWSADVPKQEHTKHSGGTVVSVDEGRGIVVASGDGAIRLGRVTYGENPRMWSDEFASRFGLSTGTVLGTDHAPDDWRYTGIRDERGGIGYPTNVQAGERVTVSAVVESAAPVEAAVNADLNGEIVAEERVSVDERVDIPFSFTVQGAGTHTLRMAFTLDGERIDTRYLKIFATD